MVRNLAPRRPNRIVRAHTAQQLPPEHCRPPGAAETRLAATDHQNGEEVEQRALLDGQPSVHVGFAHGDSRIADERPAYRGIVQADGDRRTARAFNPVRPPARVDHGQLTEFDEPA